MQPKGAKSNGDKKIRSVTFSGNLFWGISMLICRKSNFGEYLSDKQQETIEPVNKYNNTLTENVQDSDFIFDDTMLYVFTKCI